MSKLFLNWQEHLNIKKIIITVLGMITFILLIFFWITSKEDSNSTSNSSIQHPETNSTTFFSNNRNVCLELSNTYGLKQYTPKNDYLIELRSDLNLNVFVSSKDKIEGKTLNAVVSADKLAFTETFQAVSNVSELKEFTINENNYCTYSFHYLDQNLNTTFYIQITWLEMADAYYIFDIEFPLNDLNNYVRIITDTLSAFRKI